MGKNVPCYGCDVRELGCHSKCENYISWKAERDRIVKIMRIQNQLSNPEAKLHYSHCGWYQ